MRLSTGLPLFPQRELEPPRLVTHLFSSIYSLEHRSFEPTSHQTNTQTLKIISSQAIMVSSDAAIAIVFGLIGASLSFVGVIIACLTLRSMTLERYERHRRVRGDDHEPVFQHLHTHLFPSSQQQGPGNRDLKVA
ncbi:uncharacterized protein K444DRAFT_414586 [Hyaloscypha bicolor E]|uniref:Uncharacterized protein n=1 Tax=Hyaloscypha bicolor E TaxID=1095630 RepID=A0A2J6T6M6_9HELO|nr:uncharacterized protein K444DRAFT_414586 [Hyaloscypha bicolor E]PMD58672.1 hypothetical protein K444DRAFT_414586 [Hyaloscypha bicolor E]